ncbi:hypothetical protein [Methanosarcina mazei]|uniref:Uncharacterized protein n=3 Tax=Methanosarcina mazei TaxID=2209 RepID=A0A0F8VKX1_METMZ|nr:hypothetical protein [Methanosarcina mazei]AKB41347.1 hypothetical protein MSMAW_2356 [Methanosarcina mazei WWM610]AKB70960.1 hypothetical protein MSMAC_1070 [Methanosarcina mazei C16]KKG00249.1 hypothetical protein DU31_07435 [Methanosarcina mazei]KKG00631.1 hypothetical protein DU40_10125 [Methanosarcina mazei]KKG03889.1 hypothetical protein DU47_18140 [Methanosarcina mazei]
MARRPLFFCLLLFFLLAAAVSPASAVTEIHEEHIKTFSLNAPDGLSFTGMEIYDLPPNSNNTFLFNSYGKTYTLKVNSTKSWGWWTYDLSLQNPNGTIETKQLETLAPLATDWDLHVQYYFLSGDSVFDLDVYTALMPLSATLGTNNPTTSEILQFSGISGSSTAYFDMVLYATTDEEFEEQAKNALGLQLSHAVGEIFTWTWKAVLSFVGLIPYVGDDLVTAILIASYIIDEVFFYFNLFFIEYIEATILTLEFFIFSYAIINNRRRQPVNIVRAVVEYHVKAWTFIIGITLMAINLVLSIIVAVASAVNGLKPT